MFSPQMTTFYLIVSKLRLIKRPFKCNNLHRFKIILWTISAYLARSGICTTPTGSCHHHKQVHRHRGIFCRQKRPHIKQRNVGWHLFTRFGLLRKKTLFSIWQERLTTRRTYYNMMTRDVFFILISGNLLFITVEERVEFDGHLAAEGFPVKQIKIN